MTQGELGSVASRISHPLRHRHKIHIAVMAMATPQTSYTLANPPFSNHLDLAYRRLCRLRFRRLFWDCVLQAIDPVPRRGSPTVSSRASQTLARTFWEAG